MIFINLRGYYKDNIYNLGYIIKKVNLILIIN
jgi:hypothetical protein